MGNGHIWVVDYGLGNLRSVSRALEQAGGHPRTGADPALLEGCRAVILPGVGAYDAAVRNLQRAGLFPVLDRYLRSGRPFLGICLGFQLLYEGSEEGGRPGFGIIAGRVRRFPPSVKVPHIGWNRVTWPGETPALFQGIPAGSFFYFVHSFHGVGDTGTAVSEHGVPFAAALRKGNIFATQFHPEKSGPSGIRLLSNFVTRFAGPPAGGNRWAGGNAASSQTD